MSKERFNLGKMPVIHVIECQGDLVIRPWMELDMLAKGEFIAEELADSVNLKASGDLVLKVPQGASVQVTRGMGDVLIRSITGDVTLGEISGDLILNNLKSATVDHVAGDLAAGNFSGPISVQKVDGDVVARNLDGDLSLELVKGDVLAQFITGALSIAEVFGDINARSVNGNVAIEIGKRDLNLRSIGGQCLVQDIAGDIRLLGGLGPFAHALIAKGDFVLIWPLDAPLLIEAEASIIDNRLPLVDLVEMDGKLSGRIGDGDTRLSIQTGGRLVLKETEMISKKWNLDSEEWFDFDLVSELSNFGANLGAKISAMVNDEVAQDAARRMAEDFAQKAEAAAQMAAEMAGVTAERVFDRSSGAARQKKESSKEPKETATGTGKSKSSAEAQLKILKMVEEGIISPDEANMLLDAL
jgi:hypothetical protein